MKEFDVQSRDMDESTEKSQMIVDFVEKMQKNFPNHFGQIEGVPIHLEEKQKETDFTIPAILAVCRDHNNGHTTIMGSNLSTLDVTVLLASISVQFGINLDEVKSIAIELSTPDPFDGLIAILKEIRNKVQAGIDEREAEALLNYTKKGEA